MNKVIRIGIIALAAIAAVDAQAAEKKEAAPKTLSQSVNESLARLPYYGVFDMLQYEIKDNGVVELSGFAFRDSLVKEAEQAVVKVPGVTQVVNRIEELDYGVLDDEIRAKVYLTLYRDQWLSRYGTGTDQALANGLGYGPRFYSPFGPLGVGNPLFPGFNPAGEYGIHIVVNRGEVILMGQVDSEADKILATLLTRGVFPVKKVFNELRVRGEKQEPGQTTPPPQKGKAGFVVVADASTN
jgi:hypothetical protein